MSIQLGSKEKPVRVNCDVANHYRWLYVKVNYEQQQLIDALEMQEGDRLLQDFNIDRGANLSLNEVKLRFPSNSRSLSGCYVTLTVKPGPFRHRRGRSTLDLYATDVRVVHRPWWSWCW
jgi:hypothetical protein